MDKLSEQIYSTYHRRTSSLSLDKAFHFHSRLYLWLNDQHSKAELEHLKAQYIGVNSKEHELNLKKAVQSQADPQHHFYQIRRPYFEHYPQLIGYGDVLFKGLFSQLIYHLNLQKIIANIISEEDLVELENRLLADPEALAMISTHAINYLLVLNNYFFHKESRKILNHVQDVLHHQYSFENRQHVLLAIYLITHCVIGETLFYSQLPNNLSLLNDMLFFAGELIGQQYELITLDVKLEFLVSCRLCNIKHPLQKKIHQEANSSIIEIDGKYLLIDQNYRSNYNQDLESTEHRNVLYLMAFNQPQPSLSYAK